MKEGQSETPKESPEVKTQDFSENASVKIEHSGEVKENVDFSSADILDSTLAGTAKNPFVNVKEKKDLKKDLKEATDNLKRTTEEAGKRTKKGISGFFENIRAKFFGTKERREVTFSVLGAAVVGLILLFIPALTARRTDDPLAVNPETGYTNRETEWQSFTEMLRARVYDLSEPDRTAPQDAVITYFNEQKNNYRGVAQLMDIASIEAEYFLNLGLGTDALVALEAIDPDEYVAPAEDDPDYPAYLERKLNYFDLLTAAYEATGASALAEEAKVKSDTLYADYAKFYNMPTVTETE